MNSVNLFVQTRMDEAYFSDAYRAMAGIRGHEKYHEYQDVRCLVEHLLKEGVLPEQFDGFWYAYRIPHISKEFDLLKLAPGERILNIELKSQNVGEERIRRQLLQNRSYLKHLVTPVESFTFVTDEACLYHLNEKEELCRASFAKLAEVLKNFPQNVVTDQIHDLFKPNVFLVSPLTQPDKLLRGEYFLTDQQERFKAEIFEDIKKQSGIYGIYGEPGTGKTLLLYDMAMALSKYGRVCVVHGANLSEGHSYINSHSKNLTVLSPKHLTREVLSGFDYIFVDEMQRIYKELYEMILSFHNIKPIIVFFDQDQTLTAGEHQRDLTEHVRQVPGFMAFQLTNSMRISKSIWAFYKMLFHWQDKPRGEVDFSNIEIVYADNEADASKLVELYTNHNDYRFLYCTCPTDHRTFLKNGAETHRIIGQEFECVLTMMDENFYYDVEGNLCASEHENQNYDYVRMLYQNITRTREKLCILVYKNESIYKELLEMKNKRYQ